MRVGQYEVLLMNTDLMHLPERTIAGSTYAIATEGSEYIVRVFVHRDVNGKFPAARMRVGLYVDGHDVQYWKRLDTTDAKTDSSVSSISTTFWGFKKSSSEIHSFMFATPEPISSSTSTKSTSSVGKIEVVIYEAEVVGGINENTSKEYGVPTSQVVEGDKKFYMQASVGTTGGRKLENIEKFDPLLRWKNKYNHPMTSLILSYHTQDMLNIIEQIRQESIKSSVLGKRSVEEIQDADGVDDVIIVPIVKKYELVDLTDDSGTMVVSTIEKN